MSIYYFHLSGIWSAVEFYPLSSSHKGHLSSNLLTGRFPSYSPFIFLSCFLFIFYFSKHLTERFWFYFPLNFYRLCFPTLMFPFLLLLSFALTLKLTQPYSILFYCVFREDNKYFNVRFFSPYTNLLCL